MELGGRQVAVAVVVHDAEDARQRAEPTGPGAIEDALPDRVHDRDARLLQLGLRLLHALHLQVRFGGRHDVPLILKRGGGGISYDSTYQTRRSRREPKVSWWSFTVGVCPTKALHWGLDSCLQRAGAPSKPWTGA